MTTEIDDVLGKGRLSPEEDRFWEKFLAAWKEEGNPPAEMICRLARDDHGFDLAASTVQGWLEQRRIPRLFDKDGPQPFEIVLKVLRVPEPLPDWERWAREAHKAKTRRLKDEAAEAVGTKEAPASAERAADEPLDPDPPSIVERQPEPADSPLPDAAFTAETISVPEEDAPPSSRQPGNRRFLITTAVAVAVVALLAGAGVIATVWPREKPTDPLTSFEGRVNGTQAGVQDPLADIIGVWSQPGTTGGCTYSLCIHPDSRQIGTVKHGQDVKVVCVATGQRLRNGVKDTPGYHDDDRWVQLAAGQGINGTGYLSNTYFARNKLPMNLATCLR